MLKALKIIAVSFLVLVVGSLAYCRLMFPSYGWKQKMTVTVMTPDGIRRGSSVTSVLWEQDPYGGMRGDGPGGWHLRVGGEAALVFLCGGRYLFALLKSASGASAYMGSVAPASISGRRGRVINRELFDEVQDQRDRAVATIAVPSFQYPMLVTFENVDNPKSVQKVDPENLMATFGRGVTLKSITIRVTDEPLTIGAVNKVLGWLGEYYNKRLDGNRFGNPKAKLKLANSLSSGEFYTGH